MGYQKLPYDDAATTDQMASDCAEVGRTLRLAEQRQPEGTASPGGTSVFETVEVSDDLAALAGGLELHFD